MMYVNQIHTSASQIRLEKLIKERLNTGKAWEILATVAVTEQIKKRSNIHLELLSTVTPGTSQAFKIIYQL